MIKLREREGDNLYKERPQHRSISTSNSGISMDEIQNIHRDMRECLLLQITHASPKDDLAES